jgi:UDP-N-acetylmuramate dehydrogenase
MQILENISLRPYNTFGVDVKSRYFAEVNTEEELLFLLQSLEKEKKPFFLLGGGSNLLFTKDYEGTVVKISTKGINIISESGDDIFICAQAGENWDEFVGHCVENGWGGLENLSLIPGNVGTGPVQNIGAYGAEIKDVLFAVNTFDRHSQQLRIFSNSECEFAYRDSIFKKHKNQYIILSVTFKLALKPVLNLEYSGIREELETLGIDFPDIRSVRDAVCRIRTRKLPDPVKIGNSGSFFKNPVIDEESLSSLKMKFPGIVSFPKGKDVKLAAAWMIEQCGWKGFRTGDAGVHPNQPLVLVNYGNATGLEILKLATTIREDVQKKFGILLEFEVNIL